MITRHSSLILLLLLKTGYAGVIEPCFDNKCKHWKDTDGNRIEAHAAGMLLSPLDHHWYWYGETKKTDNISEHGVSCYKARTIAGPWTNLGQVLTQQDIRLPDAPGPFIVERPKVLFNNKTQKFVMWFHLDKAGYIFRHAGVAVATAPQGPFKFVHGLQPDGIPSLDMSLFQDDDGKAYFIRSCNNEYTGISQLSSNYLKTIGLLSTGPRFEGMAMFRHTDAKRTLYMMTSHLTGWDPNPLMLFRADGKNLSDPQWVNLGNPTNDNTSFNTQPTYVLPYKTKSGLRYNIYMGDNWVNAGRNGLIDASYVWLPIDDFGGQLRLDPRRSWDLEEPYNGLPPLMV